MEGALTEVTVGSVRKACWCIGNTQLAIEVGVRN